jgi:hypothetical protein
VTLFKDEKYVDVPIEKGQHLRSGKVSQYFLNAFQKMWNTAGMKPTVIQHHKDHPDYKIWVGVNSLN